MKKTFLVLSGILVFGLIAFGLAVGAMELGALLGDVNPNVAAAIVAALAAAAGAIYTQRQLRLRQIAESHRAQKVELYDVYMEIIDFILDLAKGDRMDEVSEDSLPRELETLYKKFRRGLVVWASPGVIKAYGEFRKSAETGGAHVLRGADSVFRAIRKDLGNSNWGLQYGDLMKLFLKDPEEYDRLR